MLLANRKTHNQHSQKEGATLLPLLFAWHAAAGRVVRHTMQWALTVASYWNFRFGGYTELSFRLRSGTNLIVLTTAFLVHSLGKCGVRILLHYIKCCCTLRKSRASVDDNHIWLFVFIDNSRAFLVLRWWSLIVAAEICNIVQSKNGCLFFGFLFFFCCVAAILECITVSMVLVRNVRVEIPSRRGCERTLCVSVGGCWFDQSTTKHGESGPSHSESMKSIDG